jgi:phosphonate degradation associated HDIG domain protein
MDTPHLIERIEGLFLRHGHVVYDGRRQEPVSALAHALQCAQLAEWAHAEAPLVAAALLHDVGHFLVAEDDGVDELTDDAHELRAVPFLSQAFGPAVVEPVRLHVAAKRYLVATEPRYAATLTEASQHSLQLQGGPMTAAERAAFEILPFAMDAVRLRTWDDAAKEPGKRTPSLDYYLAMLQELAAQPLVEPRTVIGPLAA